ncbi:unnamed protein product [Rhizopus stolonifer]
MQLNRSERRAIIKAEAKQLKKEGKKLIKGGKKSQKSTKYKKYGEDSLFSASESTDTFTIEYIHLSPEQENDSDSEDTIKGHKLTKYAPGVSEQSNFKNTAKNLDVVLLDENPSPSIVCEEQSYFEDQIDTPNKSTVLLACTTDTETQGLSNTDKGEDSRSIRSTKDQSIHKNDTPCEIAQPLVLTADGPDESQAQKENMTESAVGSDGSEEKNQCTFLSLSEDTTRSICDTSNNDLAILEEKSFAPSVSSASTVSVLEQEVEINIKSQSIYNHESPFPSGETLKPSGKKKNVFYRVFRKKSEKILKKLSSDKVVEEKKSKKSWKIWKRLSLRSVS